jgi:hypothetical protein
LCMCTSAGRDTIERTFVSNPSSTRMDNDTKKSGCI